MNKTYLVFKHEFLQSVKKVGWLIMTLIVPVFVLIGIGVFSLVSSLAEPEEKMVQSIGYIDETGEFEEQSSMGYIRIVNFDTNEEAIKAIVRGEIAEFFIIPSDYASGGLIERFTFEKEISTPAVTIASIKTFLNLNLLSDKVEPEITSLVISPLRLKVTRINETGSAADAQNSIGYLIIAGIFSLLLGLSLMIGATSLISGLGEEKESRLIEILFSSVSIRQLLVGKVLALGLAGLLQVVFWLASAPLLISLASSTLGDLINNMHIPTSFLILGVVYFILGYLLFAVLSIGVGAISSNAKEGGQLSLFYTLACFIPLWFSSLTIAFPNSPIWIALSIFPITAPIEVMLRLGVSDIPLWEIITSISVLIFSIVGGLILVIKIFRMNMLMHGKRLGLKEIIRSLRSA